MFAYGIVETTKPCTLITISITNQLLCPYLWIPDVYVYTSSIRIKSVYELCLYFLHRHFKQVMKVKGRSFPYYL